MRKSRSSAGRAKKSARTKNTYHRSRVRELREAAEVIERLGRKESIDTIDASSSQHRSATDQYLKGYLRGFYGSGEYVSGSYASNTLTRSALEPEAESSQTDDGKTRPDDRSATNLVSTGQDEALRHEPGDVASVGGAVAPHRAEYLLYFFLPAEQREAIPGDLLEIYATVMLPKFGVKRANRWYWFQVLRSISPLLTARVARVLKWTIATRVAGELWKRFVA
jgi:hypothetical protein